MTRLDSLNRAAMWGAGILAVAVLALTAYIAFFDGGGNEDDDAKAPGKAKDGASAAPSSPGPEPTYAAPDDWSEPERWAVLPRGKRTDDHDNVVGFEHTPEGAAAMMAAVQSTAAEGGRSLADRQMGIYDSYTAAADKNAANEAKVREQAKQADADVRRTMGLPETGEMPDGAYMRSTVVGFQIVHESRDEVGVYLLARVTMKAGETKKEKGSYTRTLLAAEWEAGDWKLSSAAAARVMQEVEGQALPKMVAPGDAAFNTAGWTAIRQAS